MNNTFSTFNRIKNDLFRLMTIASFTSMVVFMMYYVYLIVLNFEEKFYLVIYSILFIAIFCLFMVEVCLKGDKPDKKKDKRLKLERKRAYKAIIKTFKYLAKATLIGVAVYEMVSKSDFGISNLVNIVLGVFLVVQILFVIIIHFVVKYIDYIRLSIDLDISESVLTKIVQPKKAFGELLEGAAYAGDDDYIPPTYKSPNQKDLKKEYACSSVSSYIVKSTKWID